MHKEEKEKSRDTCVSGRFYKTLIKAWSPTAQIPLLSFHSAVLQTTTALQNRDTTPSKTTATLA